jgi:16S rRNA (uracil1498-N3)-methyltransferase
MHPFFFHAGPLTTNTSIPLDDATARHVVQVLRMTQGEEIVLTNGDGTQAIATIEEAGKKSCTVRVRDVQVVLVRTATLHLCIAFTKSASRNEWLLEKATEMGVASITPLITARGEKTHAKPDRWRTILISAMLQSQQAFLPALSSPKTLEAALGAYSDIMQKFFAHCLDEYPRTPISAALSKGQNAVLFIGPEGDFTPTEISLAGAGGCTPVSLGTTRLRTETAALAACALFHLVNDETA